LESLKILLQPKIKVDRDFSGVNAELGERHLRGVWAGWDAGVHIRVLGPGAVVDDEVVSLELQRPPHKARVEFAACHQPAEGAVIRDEDKRGAVEIRAEVLDRPNDGQALAFGDGVIPFGWGKRLARISDDLLRALVVELCEDGSNADAGIIGLQEEGLVEIGACQGGGVSKVLLEKFKGLLLIGTPDEGRVFAK
jgi:hypothetical protein